MGVSEKEQEREGAELKETSKLSAGQKKKRRKKSKKKKGKGGTSLVAAAATPPPHPPQTPEPSQPTKQLQEKEENQHAKSHDPEHEQQTTHLPLASDILRVTGKGTATDANGPEDYVQNDYRPKIIKTNNDSHSVSKTKGITIDTAGVAPFECSWGSVTDNRDPWTPTWDEGPTAATTCVQKVQSETEEYRSFQEGESAILDESSHPLLHVQQDDVASKEGCGKEGAKSAKEETEGSTQAPQNAKIKNHAADVNERGNTSGRGRTSGLPQVPQAAKNIHNGGKYVKHNKEGVSIDDAGDDIDDEESLLLVFSSNGPNSAPQSVSAATTASTTRVRATTTATTNPADLYVEGPCPALKDLEEKPQPEAQTMPLSDNSSGSNGMLQDPSSPPGPQRLEEHGCSTDQSKEAKRPSIWEDVRECDIAGVRAKLAAGALIDEADSQGRTPVMVACASGDVAMTSFLVKGASPPSSVAARTIEGWTPLMIASGGGRVGVAKVLLEAGAGLRDRDAAFGSNPLMWACAGGHSEVVRLLLKHGATELLPSINADMWTPLMIACDAGSLETVRVLVEAGADLGACSKDGLTALDVAASRNYLLLECYLKTEGAFSSAEFWSAADSGDAATISKLLKGNGHLVGVLDKDGRTALLLACVGRHLEVARILVEAGADVDFKDPSGTSSLNVAVVLGDMALTRYLVQAGGAMLSQRNNVGWTPLMQAVAKGDLTMARYLVDRGAAVNDGTADGGSVLDMAKRFAGPELQRYLAAKGGFSSHEVKRQIGEVNGGERGLFRLW